MTPAQVALAGIDEWLDAIILATGSERRSVAIAALDGGFAVRPVRCTRCELTTTFVGAYRHVAETEAAWQREHPEDGPNAALHRPGDLIPLSPETQPEQSFWSTSACRSCGARVVWATTSRGRRMPVDAEPSPNGNVVLAQSGSPTDPPLAVIVHTEAELLGVPGGVLRTSHFATCPNAGDWRRGKR